MGKIADSTNRGFAQSDLRVMKETDQHEVYGFWKSFLNGYVVDSGPYEDKHEVYGSRKSYLSGVW